MESHRLPWSNQTKLVVTIFTLLAGIYLLFRFRIILIPLIISTILAYILNPLVSFFQQRLHLRRSLSALLTYLLMILVSIGFLVGIIPLLANQLSNLDLDIQRLIRQINILLGRRIVLMGQSIDLDQTFEQARIAIQAAMQPVFSQTLGFVLEMITSIVWVVFIIVVAFYLIKDAEKISRWFESIIPPSFRVDYSLLRAEISTIWAAFFRGQIILALVVACLFTLIGLILGLPFALAMGVFAGLLEFLPSVGHGIWLITASLLALFNGSSWLPLPNWAFMLIVIGLHLIYQQFDLNYLIPRIIGRSVHLPPLVVILGIVTGAVLAGVLGILLAAPTIASARVLARYIYANLFDLEPFPAGFTTELPPPNPDWWRKLSPRSHKNPESIP